MSPETSPKLPFRSRLSATALYHRYRTEGDTPIRQAFAIGLGLYIGASPFVGFHLLLCLALGRLFRLNRLKVYLAANISNPFMAPFLYALEIEVGTFLRTGHLLSRARIVEVRLQGLALDLVIGSVVVGLVLAVAGMLLTWWSTARSADADAATLVDVAAERYLIAGCTAWEFARGKMRHDPVYLDVLESGRLPSVGTLLDLGCGQGFMFSLIAAARDRFARGAWPASWPAPPPLGVRLYGIELRPRVAERARRVLEGIATIDALDVSAHALPACDGVLLFDVLHLLARERQDRLLADIARALNDGGTLLLREADASRGWKFQAVRFGNRFNALWQGHFSRPFCFDTAGGWAARLADLGFEVERTTAHDAGPFGNVLLQARRLARVHQSSVGDPSGAPTVASAGQNR